MVHGVRWKHVGILLLGLLFLAAPAHAELQSTNYRLEEGAIGTGGTLQASSANFNATSSAGVLGIGDSQSANYQVSAGSPTTADPSLSFYMDDGSADFGSFSATTPAVATAQFSISNYTSYGYVVQIAGSAPNNGSYTIDPMSSTNTSQVGIEQFGINLVANTSPSSFGANPDLGNFGFGSAATNYNTPNQFRFVSGETIASAPKSSGITKYTISYLINVAGLTPGGIYKTDQTIIVTGTY